MLALFKAEYVEKLSAKLDCNTDNISLLNDDVSLMRVEMRKKDEIIECLVNQNEMLQASLHEKSLAHKPTTSTAEMDEAVSNDELVGSLSEIEPLSLLCFNIFNFKCFRIQKKSFTAVGNSMTGRFVLNHTQERTISIGTSTQNINIMRCFPV